MLSLLAAPQSPPLPYQDLVPELIEKIAASVTPGQPVHLTVAPGDDADRSRARPLERDLSEKLAHRRSSPPLGRMTPVNLSRRRRCSRSTFGRCSHTARRSWTSCCRAT